MAGAGGPLEVPAWGVALLFIGFLVLTLIWDKAMHSLECLLKRKGKRGLLEVVHHLKDELLAVGVISLLLPFVEVYMMLICVPKGLALSAPAYGKVGVTGARRLLAAAAALAEPAGHAAEAASHSAVPLGGGVGEKADYATSSSHACGPGNVQLYPVEAIHGTHIFIAMVAIVHIGYSCLNMLLCLARLHRWRRWEAAACGSPVIRVSQRIVAALARNPFTHGLVSVVSQFSLSVNQDVYCAVRRLFLEQLKRQTGSEKLPSAFPFLKFVKETTETSLGSVIGVSWYMWGFAVIHLIIPYPYRAYSLVAICVVGMILMLIAGAKLHSVVVHLAARAQALYGVESIAEHAASVSMRRESFLTSRGSAEVPALPAGKDAAAVPSKDADDAPSRVSSAQSDARPRSPAFGAAAKPQHRIRHHLHKQRAGIGRLHDGMTHRIKTDEALEELFWFKRPKLILFFYKIAFFESAFCLTLLLFGLWKDNQFLPDFKYYRGQFVAYIIVFIVNIGLCVYQSGAVLPVYALVSTADSQAVTAAGLFLSANLRHKEARAAGEEAVSRKEAHEAILKLQVLNTINMLHNLGGPSNGGARAPITGHGWARVRAALHQGAFAPGGAAAAGRDAAPERDLEAGAP
ncbi:MLO13 [Scenedesmus sp. PABB004]|nr:MLO13 [Scenedesmus sp. PABB004]